MSQLLPTQIKQIFESILKNPSGHPPQQRANCPYHEEQTPVNQSFSYNIKKAVFNCHSCHKNGTIWDFARDFEIDLRPYGISINPVYLQIVNDCHQYLIDNQECIRSCWNHVVIKELQVGYSKTKKCHVFPIFNTSGKVINVKHHKSAQIQGSHATLYPLHYLDAYKSDYIIICEGEPDAITLLSAGFQAVTSTGGALTVPNNLSALKKFKKIYLCFDNDKQGREGAEKWRVRLHHQDSSIPVYFCDLRKFVDHKGDASDYFQNPENSRETYIEDIIIDARHLATYTDVPSYAEKVQKSDRWVQLSDRDKVLLTTVLVRASRYHVKTAKLHGVRFSLKPGQYIKSRNDIAKLCGSKWKVSKVRRGMESLVKKGFIIWEDLKAKRGVRITLLHWCDETGQSKSKSIDKNMIKEKFPFFLLRNDLDQFLVRSKKSD